MSGVKTVLVVDDSPVLLEGTARLCRQAGFEVDTAANGAEALLRVRERPPRLVLLDMELPDLTGLEVLRQIRDDPALAAVSVVFLSGHQITAGQQTAALDAGADGYIARPIANQELLARIRAQWRQSEMADALRASEARFRSLITMQADGVLVVDGEGTIRFANPAAEALFARPAPELIGSPFGFPLENQGHLPIELLQPSGQYLIAEMRAAPILWQGQPHWIATLRDVSEHHQIEAVLRQNEENLHAFFDTSNDFAWVLDPHGNILHVNATVISRLGYTEAELVGQSVLNVHPEARREEAGRIVGEMLAGRCEFCPVPLVTRDGRHIPVETRVTPGRWSGQAALFGISKDVSALRASEEKFSKAFHRNPALMAVSALSDGRYMEVNESFLETLGFTRAEVIGRTALELGLFANSGQRESWMRSLWEKGSLHNHELTVRAKDGRLRAGLFSADIVELQGQPMVLTVMSDITQRKLAEAQVQELLLQTQRDAQTKAELLKEVNHRVKNSLLAILGLAATEQRHLSAEEKPVVRRFTENFRRRIGGLLQAHQLLSASQWAPLPVNQLAWKTIQSALATAPSSCSVTVNLQPSAVKISPRQASNLALVFNELATNTVKYALANRTTAVITFAATATESLIRLEYRDDGPGYPPEVLRQERWSVGMILVRDLTTQTLRGNLTISNDNGAVTVLEIKTEEVDRT